MFPLAAGVPPQTIWVVPFAALLLAIAVLPLVAHHFWESNRNKAIAAGAIAAPTLAYLAMYDPQALGHAGLEYMSFVGFLGALYVVAGGIRVTGDIEARPAVNVSLLVCGALLANIVGTTGASMLLIR